MPKDLFIVDTRCHLNTSIKKAFEKNGFECEVIQSLSIANLEYQNKSFEILS